VRCSELELIHVYIGPIGTVSYNGVDVDMDLVTMYEYFSEYRFKCNPKTGEYTVTKRRRPCVVTPTPLIRSSLDDERWCYQMLMMFTPFRNHTDVMVHPKFRDLSTRVLESYVDRDLTEAVSGQTSAVDAGDSDDEQDMLVPDHEEDAVPVVQEDGTCRDVCGYAGAPPNVVLTQPLPASLLCSAATQMPQATTLHTGSSRLTTHCTLESLDEEEDLEEVARMRAEYSSASALRDPSPILSTGDIRHSEEEHISPTSSLPQTQGESTDLAPPQVLTAEPFKSACALLRVVVNDGSWPEKYRGTHLILGELEAIMKQSFIDSNTMPTEAEVLTRLRAIGLDPDTNVCVDELMTKLTLDYNMRLNSGLTQVDDPDNFTFRGSHYSSDVSSHATEARNAFKHPAVPHTREESNPAAHASTPADLADGVAAMYAQVAANEEPYKKFTLRQRAVLLTVLAAIEDLIRVEGNIMAPQDARTCRLVLQGEAGTGKSYVLEEAVKIMCSLLGPHRVRVVAPTAFAAKTYEHCACSATTLHRVFNKNTRRTIDVEDWSDIGARIPSLLGGELTEWTNSMRGVAALVCDEMSMVSPSDVELMSRRFHDAFHGPGDDSDPVPFNNLPIVILCGDLYQLPPVRALPLYSETLDIAEEKQKRQKKNSKKLSESVLDELMQSKLDHNKGLYIYRTFFDKAIMLLENKRQADDKRWQGLLKRVRVGEATPDDRVRLASKVYTLADLAPTINDDGTSTPSVFRACPRYYPLVKQVLEESKKMLLQEFPNPDSRFDASAFIQLGNKPAKAEDIRKYGNDVYKLAYPLPLAKGAKVMVTTNMNGARDWGIVNGSTGTVVGYITENGSKVKYVLVELDAALPDMPPLKLHVPPVVPGGPSRVISMRNVWAVPTITRTVRKYVDKEYKDMVSIVIRYFPLVLAYSLTVHKAQGVSTNFAVVDIVGCRSGQMPYVALSRVRKEEGIRLLNVPSLSDINKFSTCKEKGLLEAEFSRIQLLMKEVLSDLALLDDDRLIWQALELEEAQEACRAPRAYM